MNNFTPIIIKNNTNTIDMKRYLFSIISCKYLAGFAILLIVFTFVLFLGVLCFDILFTYLYGLNYIKMYPYVEDLNPTIFESDLIWK